MTWITDPLGGIRYDEYNRLGEKMKKLGVVGLLLGLVSLHPLAQPLQLAEVLDVIDGDTIKVNFLPAGPQETIKYLGIDAPQIDRCKECYGAEAKRRNEDLVKGFQVRIEHSNIRKEGKLLAVVWVDRVNRGRVMVNELLVQEGFATAFFEPNTNNKYRDRLKKAHETAKKNKIGLWKWCFKDSKEFAVVIADIDFDGPDNKNQDEIVTIENKGKKAADLSLWRLISEPDSQCFFFPFGFILRPGAKVRIHSGPASKDKPNTATDLYWIGELIGKSVWDDLPLGDVGYLLGEDLKIMHLYEYGEGHR